MRTDPQQFRYALGRPDRVEHCLPVSRNGQPLVEVGDPQPGGQCLGPQLRAQREIAAAKTGPPGRTIRFASASALTRSARLLR